MATSSSILPARDEPTTILRYGPSPHQLLDSLPPLPTLPASHTPLPVGVPAVQVPGYDIIRELGRGGMGVVYLARHRRLDRLVALKMVLARQYAGADDQQRFRQEVEAVARLNHPHIAQVYEVGEHDGFAFAAFEYVDGGTLLAWQAGRKVLPGEAVHLIATIARAVQFAHDHGIIHRDLKPANILMQGTEPRSPGSDLHLRRGTDSASRSSSTSVSADPRFQTPVPKITDFGLAKRLDGHSDLTVTGMACGTPNYMAPEQIRGKQAQVGPWTDVYGLGAILFELLTGKAPFSGETPLATMQSVLRDPPPAARSLRAEVPRDLAVIAAKCLEKEPGRRYHSAAELADDLDRYQTDVPILARGVGRLERGRRWVRRNPLATALLLSLAAGFASMMFFASVLWQRAQDERQLREVVEAARGEANDQRKIAEERQADAAKQARSADEARKHAETMAARSADALLIATDSIDTVLAKFATDPRFHDSDCLDLRKHLLQESMQLYDRIRSQAQDSPEYEHRSTRAIYFFGLLTRSIGRIEEGNGQIIKAALQFAALVKRHPARCDWQIEYANMLLDELERAREDGTLDRQPAAEILATANAALDKAERNRADLCDWSAKALLVARAKAQLREVTLAAAKSPAEYLAAAQAARPAMDAALAAQPRDPEAVRLAGRLLLELARAAARFGDLAAAAHFEDAEQHFFNAVKHLFPANRYTRWNCEYALARQAHGEYLDAQGRHAEAEERFKSTEFILENLVDKIPELTAYRVELVEANLHNLRRRMKRDPNYDPVKLADQIDYRLAPFWNLGKPTDRARHVIGETKILLAEWFASKKRHIDSGNEYLTAANLWLYQSQPQEETRFRGRARLAWSLAAVQFAQAKQRPYVEQSFRMIAQEKNQKVIPGEVWYELARASAHLAVHGDEQASGDLETASEMLRKAEQSGFFKYEANRRRFEKDTVLDSIRGQIKP